jgi:hypothetical protein
MDPNAAMHLLALISSLVLRYGPALLVDVEDDIFLDYADSSISSISRILGRVGKTAKPIPFFGPIISAITGLGEIGLSEAHDEAGQFANPELLMGKKALRKLAAQQARLAAARGPQEPAGPSTTELLQMLLEQREAYNGPPPPPDPYAMQQFSPQLVPQGYGTPTLPGVTASNVPTNDPRLNQYQLDGDEETLRLAVAAFDRFAQRYGYPLVRDVFPDVLEGLEHISTVLNDGSACCSKCAADIKFDEERFYESSWFKAALADLPTGEGRTLFGQVDMSRRPFDVKINNKLELPRAQIAFAHEALHTLDETMKWGLTHEQIHDAAVMLVGEVLPGLNAMTAVYPK